MTASTLRNHSIQLDNPAIQERLSVRRSSQMSPSNEANVPSTATTRISRDGAEDSSPHAEVVDETLKRMRRRRNRRMVVSGLAAGVTVLVTLGPVGVVATAAATGYAVRRVHKRRERRYKARKEAEALALEANEDDLGSEGSEDFEAFDLYVADDGISVISSLSGGSADEDGTVYVKRTSLLVSDEDIIIKSASLFQGTSVCGNVSVAKSRSASLFRGVISSVSEPGPEDKDAC